MSVSFLFGAFDHTAQAAGLLTGSVPEGVTNTGNILFKDFQWIASDDCILICHCRIYNPDALSAGDEPEGLSVPRLLLSLYNREGLSGFRRINGLFTIIIQDRQGIMIVRDMNGEGPVIYYNGQYFTGYLAGFLQVKGYSPEPDVAGMTTFLKIGYIPAPLTSLKGVSKVPAGTAVHFRDGRCRVEELFPFEEVLHTERKERPAEEAVEEYHALLRQSIRRRIGDQAVAGTLLSGGYDSGGCIAILREVHPGEIRSYSVGFRDNPASELPFARMMAEKFGAIHHEFIMDGSEIDYLPEIVRIMGDPFAESGVMLNYAAMKMVAGENLPVVLGGDGNDQYFGAGIRETAFHYRIRSLGLKPLSCLLDALTDNRFFDHDNLAFRIHYQNQKILRIMDPETFGFHDYQLHRMFGSNRIRGKAAYNIPSAGRSYDGLFLQRNYFLHLLHSVREVIIHKASRLSAGFGVNLTFPYIDPDIYHFIRQLPVSLRARGSVSESMTGKGISKFIHKELVKPLLPPEVSNRPKQGGFSPLDLFFGDKQRREAIYRYILASALVKTMQDPGFVKEFLLQYEALISGKGYWFWYRQVKSSQMINLLILTLWYDMMMEGRSENRLSGYLG